MVVLPIVRKTDNVPPRDAAEISEGVLKHRTGVGYLEEIDVLRLQLDECGLGEADVGDRYDGSLFDAEVLHHPVGNIAAAFFRGEFEDAAVGQRVFLR